MMRTRHSERSLELTFWGGAFTGGSVPASLLASKLQALQNLLFHAAAAVTHDPTSRRGSWTSRHRAYAELRLVGCREGSFVAELDLPAEKVLGPDFDYGLGALDLVFRVGESLVSDQEFSSIPAFGKDELAYILRGFEALTPNAADDYEIRLTNSSPNKHPPLKLSADTRRRIRHLLETEVPQLSEEVTSLVGELTKICIVTGPEKIAIRHKGREIECFYPESLRDQIANLMAGSMVEVSGDATIDSDGRVVQVDRIHEVFTVSMDPLRLTRFEAEGTVYHLKEPLVVDVEYSDEMWVFRNDLINLWGFGERREDALRDLHENFAYLWHEIAQETDELLDSHAIDIKRVLSSVVEQPNKGVQ